MATTGEHHLLSRAYLPTPPSSSSRTVPVFQYQQSSSNTNNVRKSYNHFTSRRTRNRRILRDNLPAAINKPVIRRLARRGGIRRIQMTIYETVQQVVKNRLNQILDHAIAVCEHTGRKTLTSLDIVYALRVLGSPIYGFGSVIKGEDVRSRAKYARERKARNMVTAREYVARLEREAAEALRRGRGRRNGEDEEEEEEDEVEENEDDGDVKRERERHMRENRNRKVDVMERAMRMGVRV